MYSNKFRNPGILFCTCGAHTDEKLLFLYGGVTLSEINFPSNVFRVDRGRRVAFRRRTAGRSSYVLLSHRRVEISKEIKKPKKKTPETKKYFRTVEKSK